MKKSLWDLACKQMKDRDWYGWRYDGWLHYGDDL